MATRADCGGDVDLYRPSLSASSSAASAPSCLSPPPPLLWLGISSASGLPAAALRAEAAEAPSAHHTVVPF